MVETKFGNIGELRKGETEQVPLGDRKVTFIFIGSKGEIYMDHTIGGKKAMLSLFRKGNRILAAWTGKWTTDIFELDVALIKKGKLLER